MSSRLVGLSIALAMAGCGARSEISDASGAGGSSHASTTSATSTGATSTSSSGGGGSGGAPCTWGFGPEVEVAAAPNAVAQAAVDGDHVLLMTTVSAGYAASTLSFDLGSLGAPHALPTPPSPINTVALAAGFGHALFVSSAPFHGSDALSLDASGEALGTFHVLGGSFDSSTAPVAIATPSGFIFFAGAYVDPESVAPPVGMGVVDANGKLHTPDPENFHGLFPIGSAGAGKIATRLASVVGDDGSIVSVYPHEADEKKTTRATRFNAKGEELHTRSLSASGSWIAAVSLGSTVLVAWNDATNVVRAATLDASLHLGPSQVVAAASNQTVLALVDGGPGPGKLLVTASGSHPASAQWIDVHGIPIGGPFTSNIANDGPYPLVVATPSGPIAFGAHTAQRVLCQ